MVAVLSKIQGAVYRLTGALKNHKKKGFLVIFAILGLYYVKRKRYHEKFLNAMLGKLNARMTASMQVAMEESKEVEEKLKTLYARLKKNKEDYPKQWNIFWKRHLDSELHEDLKLNNAKGISKNAPKADKEKAWSDLKNAIFLKTLWTLLSKSFMEVAWLIRDLLMLKNEPLLNKLISDSVKNSTKLNTNDDG
jgi:hypothetical protein